jgi:hypothetical protein
MKIIKEILELALHIILSLMVGIIFVIVCLIALVKKKL